jgi:hypothetical protein
MGPIGVLNAFERQNSSVRSRCDDSTKCGGYPRDYVKLPVEGIDRMYISVPMCRSRKLITSDTRHPPDACLLRASRGNLLCSRAAWRESVDASIKVASSERRAAR